MTTINYQLTTERNLRRVLTDEWRVLYRTAFWRCGRGLTELEFDEIVQKLHTEGFLTISLSRRNKRRLELMKGKVANA